jgi:hypothetical protein
MSSDSFNEHTCCLGDYLGPKAAVPTDLGKGDSCGLSGEGVRHRAPRGRVRLLGLSSSYVVVPEANQRFGMVGRLLCSKSTNGHSPYDQIPTAWLEMIEPLAHKCASINVAGIIEADPCSTKVQLQLRIHGYRRTCRNAETAVVPQAFREVFVVSGV